MRWALPRLPGERFLRGTSKEREQAMPEQRKLRVGMVGGGGPANFFGAPHRRAIVMDNSAELTAGALRSQPAEALASARELFMPRGYPNWEAMIQAEDALPESDRIDHDTIAT